MGSLQIFGSDIVGVYAVDTKAIGDHRGMFARYFCEQELESILCGRRIVQVNMSRTTAVGAIRGMHFQHAPHAEMKLIRCLRGRVWDVAVDLRADSRTFLQWHAEDLSECNKRMMVIPEGFAHGFQCLEANSELLYLHTAAYEKTSEGGVRHDDPRLSIDWPLAVSDISDRDLNHPLLTESFPGIST